MSEERFLGLTKTGWIFSTFVVFMVVVVIQAFTLVRVDTLYTQSKDAAAKATRVEKATCSDIAAQIANYQDAFRNSPPGSTPAQIRVRTHLLNNDINRLEKLNCTPKGTP